METATTVLSEFINGGKNNVDQRLKPKARNNSKTHNLRKVAGKI